MPVWGIFVTIIGYLGIGIGCAFYVSEDDSDDAGSGMVIMFWPILVLAGIVAGLLRACDRRGKT